MKIKLFSSAKNMWSLHPLAVTDRITFEEDQVSDDGTPFDTVNFESLALASQTVGYLYEQSEHVVDSTVYFAVKAFDGKTFSEQLAAGVGLFGHFGEGQGLPIPVGCGIRFVTSEKLSSLFNDKLSELLKTMGHIGFVTLECAGDLVKTVHLGCPSFLGYALMEGWRGRLSEFVAEPLKFQFTERWFVASLVHVYPYPFLEETKEKADVRGLIRDVRKHFWAFAPNGVMKEGFKTKATALGVATGFDRTVFAASSRVLRTCGSLLSPMIQYRKDLAETVQRKWTDVERFL